MATCFHGLDKLGIFPCLVVAKCDLAIGVFPSPHNFRIRKWQTRQCELHLFVLSSNIKQFSTKPIACTEIWCEWSAATLPLNYLKAVKIRQPAASNTRARPVAHLCHSPCATDRFPLTPLLCPLSSWPSSLRVLRKTPGSWPTHVLR